MDVEELEAEDGDADEEVVEEDAADKVATGEAEKMMLSVKKKEDIDLGRVSHLPQPHTYHNHMPVNIPYLYRSTTTRI